MNQPIVKFLSIIHIICMLNFTSYGQVPKGLNFQTIVRDNTGKPLGSRNVNFRFSILQGGTSGQVVFSEEHRAITNEFGLVNLLLGYGFPVSGAFDQIKWSDGSLFLKTEIDPNGGINYELSNVSPFLSVPYALYADKTQLNAGPGILIEGNKISNTGDPDGSNDLLINSPASGDLSGTYPNPKVSKLNGYPLLTTAPDSGDVLVFSQGEWKHFPIGSTPAASDWKRVGNEIQLQDPATIQKLNVANAVVQSQNILASYKGTDSSSVSPLGIQLRKGMGAMQSLHSFAPESDYMYYGNKYLFGRYSFISANPFVESEYWNNDPANKSIRSAINPYAISFEMTGPERAAYLYGSGLIIERKSKDSPVEFSGLDVRDSTMYYYSGARDILGIESSSNYGGALFAFDKAGKERISITSLASDQTQPYIGLFSTKTNREVASLNGFNSAGEFQLNNSTTNQYLVYAGYSTNGPSYPWLGIGDSNGGDAAGMYLSTGGQGVVFADIKNFRMDDPANKNQEIWYACIEGPEAAAYERGTSHLIQGEVFIPFSDHFKKVINPNSITVQLTPGSAETFGLAVIEKNDQGFRVKELQSGKGNFNFDWEVKAVRKGYESYEVYHEKVSLRAKTNHQSIKSQERSSQQILKTRQSK